MGRGRKCDEGNAQSEQESRVSFRCGCCCRRRRQLLLSANARKEDAFNVAKRKRPHGERRPERAHQMQPRR